MKKIDWGFLKIFSVLTAMMFLFISTYTQTVYATSNITYVEHGSDGLEKEVYDGNVTTGRSGTEDILETSKTMDKIANDEYEITLSLKSYRYRTEVEYIVLLLDTTGSMCSYCIGNGVIYNHSGSCAAKDMKEAAKNFVEETIKASYGGDLNGQQLYETQIAIVEYGRAANPLSGDDMDDLFVSSNDREDAIDELQGYINDITYLDPVGIKVNGSHKINETTADFTHEKYGASGYAYMHAGTNTGNALYFAHELLESESGNSNKKAVVLFTDGQPTALDSTSSNINDTNGYSYYNYYDNRNNLDSSRYLFYDYNGAYELQAKTYATYAADKIKDDGMSIFTVYFANSKDAATNKNFLANDIATSPDYAFAVDNSNKLTEAFENMSRTLLYEATAKDIVLTDVIPSKYDFIDFVGTAIGANHSGGTITWSLNTLGIEDDENTATLKYKIKPNFENWNASDLEGVEKIATNDDENTFVEYEGRIDKDYAYADYKNHLAVPWTTYKNSYDVELEVTKEVTYSTAPKGDRNFSFKLYKDYVGGLTPMKALNNSDITFIVKTTNGQMAADAGNGVITIADFVGIAAKNGLATTEVSGKECYVFYIGELGSGNSSWTYSKNLVKVTIDAETGDVESYVTLERNGSTWTEAGTEATAIFVNSYRHSSSGKEDPPDKKDEEPEDKDPEDEDKDPEDEDKDPEDEDKDPEDEDKDPEDEDKDPEDEDKDPEDEDTDDEDTDDEDTDDENRNVDEDNDNEETTNEQYIETEFPGIYTLFDETGVPSGYFKPVVSEDGTTEWVMLMDDELPTGLAKMNPKTGMDSKATIFGGISFINILIMCTIMLVGYSKVKRNNY